jgi:hypothetical protein
MPAAAAEPTKTTGASPAPLCAPQNNVGNFDLSSVFHVQDDYLFAVTNAADTANNAPEVVAYVDNIQTNLHSLSDKFRNANSSSQAVLAHQQEMLDIVNAEKTRLAQKKQLVDSADLQQKHVMVLNDTYRKQYMEYTKMLIVVVIGVSAYIVIRMLSDFLQIPEWIYILLHIANIFICLICITYFYAVIQSRSKVDFDRLEIPPPNTSPGAASADLTKSDKNKNLFGDFCFGKDCCDTNNGVKWNDDLQMCVMKGAAPSPPPLTKAPAAAPVPIAPKTTEQFATYSSYGNSQQTANPMLPNPRGQLDSTLSMHPLDFVSII